tara:strand:+ start:34 stop:336 length:303 start_codon:yes stop_codon:yes gene_type:complete
MDDQQNIKEMKEKELDVKRKEWELITSKMKAGSGATGVNVSTIFRPEASILQELKKELQNQGDALAEFQTQDWQDEDEFVVLGWIEALEFAIKLIEGHNK